MRNSSKSSEKVLKKSSKIDAKSSQKVVLEPLGKHVAKRCGKSCQKVCPGDPKGAPNPPKIYSRTLLGPSLDPLWWSKFGLESLEEAQGGSKGRQGGPRSPKRYQNQSKIVPDMYKIMKFLKMFAIEILSMVWKRWTPKAVKNIRRGKHMH